MYKVSGARALIDPDGNLVFVYGKYWKIHISYSQELLNQKV